MMRDTHWLLITRSKQTLPYNQRQVIARKITLNAKGDEKIVTLRDKIKMGGIKTLQHRISSEFYPGVEIQTAEERTTSKRLIQTRENQSRRGQTRSNIKIGT